MLRRFFQHFRSELAVDLGTVNTRIGVVGEGIVVNEPSVVAVQQSTGRVLSGGRAVGHLARQMQGRTPDSIAVIRPLKDGVIADFKLCEAMLRYFFRKAQPSGWRLRPRVLVGVPGGITPVQRQAVFSSMQRAGAGEVWLLSAAKAAALGCGLPIAEPLASMICNIGGGTTEVAVMSMADAVAWESIRTGGDAFDQAVVDYLRRTYSLRIGLPAAECLRIDIGSAYPLDEEQTAEVHGLDAVSGLPRRVSVTSEELREAMAEPLLKILEAVKAVLDRLTPDLAADLVDQGLVLCGGAQLRRLDRYLGEHTGLPVRVAPEPTTAVVAGLTICLEHLAAWRHIVSSSEEDTE